MNLQLVSIDKNESVLHKFYDDHSTDGLFKPLQSIIKEGRESYVVLNGGNIVAAVSTEKITDHMTKLHSSLVHTDHRGKGIGRFLNEEIEKVLKSKGVGKVVGYVYITNLSNIFLKLKMGYIIEGTLRDHDYPGQHEYVISKML
jgi:N-acetylglutamate synthase-like GNAT family acetyltransferase